MAYAVKQMFIYSCGIVCVSVYETHDLLSGHTNRDRQKETGRKTDQAHQTNRTDQTEQLDRQRQTDRTYRRTKRQTDRTSTSTCPMQPQPS